MYYDDRNNFFEYEKNNYLNLEENISNNKDIYNEIKFDNFNINNNYYRASELYNPYEGFNKGNMFKNLYKPYKNYNYKVVANGKRENLLLKIHELTFASKDLNLYLDIYPFDEVKLKLFKEYMNELNKLKEEYNKLYSPLCLNDVNKSTFDWVNSPWPWVGIGGSINV